jgi:hypothetical protein
MAVGLLLVTGGRRVAGGDFLPGVNDQTVSPAMLKLSHSAFEGGAGVHAVRAGEPVQGPGGQDLVRVSRHRGLLHPVADARRGLIPAVLSAGHLAGTWTWRSA